MNFFVIKNSKYTKNNAIRIWAIIFIIGFSMKGDNKGYEITIIGEWYKCNKYENLPVLKKRNCTSINRMKTKKERENLRKSL